MSWQTSLKHYLLPFLLGSVIFVSLFFVARESGEEVSEQVSAHPFVMVGETEVLVEVVDTPEERTRGLSGKETLGEENGMLFIFERPGVYPFWMKEMRFSIDIIWIDESFHVADITEEVSPGSFPNTFSPALPVRYVLEVPAGFIKKHGITKGEQVIFSLADGEATP
ncbi:MAG: DUF192 domain-containing protein [Patescibacteria group bacterium]